LTPESARQLAQTILAMLEQATRGGYLASTDNGSVDEQSR
jgi:hypothetical protein